MRLRVLLSFVTLVSTSVITAKTPSPPTLPPPQRPIQQSGPSIHAPTVATRFGTVVGKFLSSQNQDAFLGIPYAQPPVGELRFRSPVAWNSSWKGVRDAKSYGSSCWQNTDRTDMSEDCLVLNVIRSSEVSKDPLPVFVSIYGGGFTVGSSSDQLYNLTGLVQRSQQIRQPIIAVSMNYRVDVWGFLSTPSLVQENHTNAGLLDQRMAFSWIKQNIASFGGDPSRITLWGVSAGAQSIGLHLHSFGGRDDGLFHGAILEAGGPVGTALQELPYYDKPFQELAKANGCESADDKVDCLRKVPAAEFFKNKTKALWNPIVDGSFLTNFPSVLTTKNQLIKIPLMVGANSDEGASFSNRGAKSDADIATWLQKWRSYNLSTPSITRLLQLYDNYTYPPYLVNKEVHFDGTGEKWRKSGAIGGDLVMIAGRRKMAEVWTRAGQKVWSMRFDTPAWNAKPTDGSKHASEIIFSFQNITGLMGPLPKFQHHKDLSEAIGRAYVNFVNRFDPNGGGPGGDAVDDGSTSRKDVLPYWPSYGDKVARNMVLNADGPVVENDDWRKEGIDFINGISRELMA